MGARDNNHGGNADAPRRILKDGDEVEVYYRREYQQEQYRFFCALSRNQGLFRPRFGMSDGWVAAQVKSDFDETRYDPDNPNNTGVHLDYSWPMWYNHRGFLLDDLSDVVPPCRVRQLSGSARKDMPFTVETPSVGLLVVRWGGCKSPSVPSQWGSSGPPISDNFISRLVTEVGGKDMDVEVWSLFVESSEDLRKFSDSAHLILHAGHPLMRCKKVYGCYHLYPTGFEEFSHPYLETGEENGAGFIHQRTIMEVMQAVERCDVPTLFPHPSNLYDLLASKRWTHMLCMDSQFAIPATVALPRAKALSASGSRAVISALNRVKNSRGKALPSSKDGAGGVTKLGYSWEALDVKRWRNEKELAEVLQQLVGHVYIDDNLTGQSHTCDAIISQEFVVHKSELRCYVVNHEIAKFVWTKFERVNDQFDFKDFEQATDDKDACARWFDGDENQLEKAKEEAEILVARWLIWLEAQTCERIPAIRFDFFVTDNGLRTAEICECGFSMLYDEDLPTKVFKALANHARSEQGCVKTENK